MVYLDNTKSSWMMQIAYDVLQGDAITDTEPSTIGFIRSRWAIACKMAQELLKCKYCVWLYIART